MNEEIQKIIISEGNSKIKDSSSYDYLNCLTKTELFKVLSLYRLSMDDVIEAYVLENKSKKQLIKYITENLDKVMEINFRYIKNKDLNTLKNILPKIIEKDFDITEDNIPFTLFTYLKKLNLSKFEVEDEKIKMFMPKEFCESFLKILKNQKQLKDNKKMTDIFDYICALTNTYGIIDLDNLHRLFKKDMYDIDKDEFIKTLSSLDKVHDEINMFEYGDNYIICTIDFMDEQVAVNFYEEQAGDYTEYTKEELALIKNGTFIRKSSHFKEFTDYINSKFELTNKDIDDILDMLVMEYILTASINEENANKNFLENASEMFDLSDEEIEEMRKITSQIYADYPKWIKRGAI